MKTIIVNCLAGPGAGKTTAAWEIASELKKRNIVTEYVSEYAKELVWDNKLDILDGSEKNQALLLEEQNRRLERLVGKVSVVVTDSPLILNYQYLKEPSEAFKSKVLETFYSYNNFNVFIKRGKSFEKQGRIHDLKESIDIDKSIQGFMKENNIYFGAYSQNTVALICNNIEHSLLNNTKFNEENIVIKSSKISFEEEKTNEVFTKEQKEVINVAITKGLSQKQIAVFAKKNYPPEKMKFISDLFIRKQHKAYQLLKPYFKTANVDVLKLVSKNGKQWSEAEVKFIIEKSPDLLYAREISKFINAGIKVNPYLKAGFTSEMLSETFEILYYQKCSIDTFNNFALDESLTLDEKKEMIKQENSFVLEKMEENKHKPESEEKIFKKTAEDIVHDDR